MSSWEANVELVQNGHAVNAAGQSKRILNRFVLFGPTAPPGYGINLAALAADFITKTTSAWAGCMATGYLDDYLEIRQMDDATTASLIVAPGMGNGTNGILADMMAPDQTVYFKLKGNKRGANFKGSKHFSPITETDVTQGVLTTLAAGRFATLMTALFLGFSDGVETFRLGIMSQNKSQISVNPTDITVTPCVFTKSTISKTMGTQRHRRYPTLLA